MKFYLISLLAEIVVAEKLVGSFVLCRHGDRLKKPTLYLSPIGAQEEENVGNFYRERYNGTLQGLSDVYNASEITVTTPGDSAVLFKSALAFMQAFYPPTEDLGGSDIEDAEEVPGASFENGTVITAPLDGYQYVMIDSYDETSNLFWRVSGDSDCPKCVSAQKAYMKSSEFEALNKSTVSFYKQMGKYVPDIPESQLNFGNAYKIFDHMEYKYWHNETFRKSLDENDFFQVRTLQDQYSAGLNYNKSNPDSMLGGATSLGMALDYLHQVQNQTAPAMSLLMGSYDLFYQSFGLLGLFDRDPSLFTGIVDYATSMVFEVFETDGQSEKMIRVGVRNGTTITQPSTELTFWPTFNNQENATTLENFVQQLSKVAINNATEWCSRSQSTTSVACLLQNDSKSSNKHSPLSLVDAGGIGAGVTVGAFLIAGILAFWIYRWRFANRSRTLTDKSAGMELASLDSKSPSTIV